MVLNSHRKLKEGIRTFSESRFNRREAQGSGATRFSVPARAAFVDLFSQEIHDSRKI